MTRSQLEDEVELLRAHVKVLQNEIVRLQPPPGNMPETIGAAN